MPSRTAAQTVADEQILRHAQAAAIHTPQLFTREGWNLFVRRDVVPVDLPDCAPAGTELDAYDPRLVYNSHLRVVRYPAFDDAMLRAAHTFQVNGNKTDGLLDTVIDGPPGTGKSLLLRAIGRALQQRIEKWHTDRIPVVHITTPYDQDKVHWIWEIAGFLGLTSSPTSPHALRDFRRYPDLSVPVTLVLERAKTQIILIDDIQRSTVDALAPVLHYFDYLRSRLGIAVIFCGTGATDIVFAARTRIDRHDEAFHHAALRAGPSAAKAPMTQRADRSLLPVTWLDPLPRKAGEQHTWLKVLKGFENDLRLHHLSEHALSRHAAYLHDRTGGYLKHLAHLICQTAVAAIEDGTEDITLELLTATHVGWNDTHPTPAPGPLQAAASEHGADSHGPAASAEK
ncbi:ATP-binding protein [Kitasatospora aureofaciens]|uniref:ATP-binding protein n=1 Tax=Kitasatospora aureofaciens TaxID=1894 RepID=UPI0037CC44AA